MVDVTHGPLLYSAIGLAAILILSIMWWCCCRTKKHKKEREVCLTPTYSSINPNTKHHYALDMEAVMVTSPTTQRVAPPPPQPSLPSRTNLKPTDHEVYAMITSPVPASTDLEAITRRNSALYASMRKSIVEQAEVETTRNSIKITSPTKSSPPRRNSSARERDSLKEPIVAIPMSAIQAPPREEVEIPPTSPVPPVTRVKRRSFAKESEVAPTSPTTPNQRESSVDSLAIPDLEWIRSIPVPMSPIYQPSQRLAKIEMEDDSLKTPPRILTPKRKKSVTFEIPDDVELPSSRPATPRGLWINTNRTSMANDPLAIAEDPVIIASRLPFETIKTTALVTRDGFGETYKGTYRDTTVMIKRLLPESRRDLVKIESLLKEVKLMAGMDHAHIVQFIGVAWDSFSDICVVTEYMAGGDLRTALDHFNKLGRPLGFDKQKATIALHVAHALTYLHSLDRAVLYRDIKSKNILLNEEQHLAKLATCSVSREWQDGTMSAGVGTVLWMAPEVMTGNKYDEKADVYSFGVLLSELDTYLLPYADFPTEQGDVDREITRLVATTVLLHRILAGKATVTFSKELRRDVRKLGEVCVQLDPSKRPTAAQVLYELQKIERTMESEISIVL